MWRSPGFASPACEWALDQLTDPTKRDDTSGASLRQWLYGAYDDAADDVLASLSALSGIAVVTTDLALVGFRPNRSADDAHRLTSDEVSAFRVLLDP